MVKNQHQQGFTLLETLVALVIASLVSVLIMQGLSHALMLRERVLELTQYQREDALRRGWFNDSVQSLVADLPEIERHRFEGEANGFRGLTLSALQELPGVPTTMAWQLEREGEIFRLLYGQGGNSGQLAWAWQAPRARFSYFSPETGWQEAWPPAGYQGPPLPALVAFETEWRGRPVTWVAAVQGGRAPRDGLKPMVF